MMTLLVARKALLATPLLAFFAAVNLRSTDVPDSERDGVQDTMAISNCTYYTTAAHSVVVGQFGMDCCNNPVAWGKKTAYKVCGGCFICFPPPR